MSRLHSVLQAREFAETEKEMSRMIKVLERFIALELLNRDFKISERPKFFFS